MICKMEYVGIHLFQIPRDWNVIPYFGIQFLDGRYHTRRIVKETVVILWKVLHPLHMPLPTRESLKNNTGRFPTEAKNIRDLFSL
jgi:hypothetical protein